MPTLYTIGHSTHYLADFIALLKNHHITHIIDVRAKPASRRMPWFNQVALKTSLAKENILYTHMPALGGMRIAHADSINEGVKKPSHRAYADYMQTSQFSKGLDELNKLLTKGNVAILCAEGKPLDCHRSLISDAEIARGIKVLHILPDNNLTAHELTANAVIHKTPKTVSITYPKRQQGLF